MILKSLFYWLKCIFSDENFQIRSTGNCFGDSGGPLIVYDELKNPPAHIQVGIVQGALDCASKTFPGIYARIDNPDVWTFIDDTINNKNKGNYSFTLIILQFIFHIILLSVILFRWISCFWPREFWWLRLLHIVRQRLWWLHRPEKSMQNCWRNTLCFPIHV